MLDHHEFQRWCAAAESARTSARLQATSGQYNWGCFLAEQAAQLAVKGLLHGIGAGGCGHDLVELGARLEHETDEALPTAVAAALRRLSRHYIPTRYPDAHPSGPPGAHYGHEDVDHALEDLSTTLEHIEGIWIRLGGVEPDGGE